MSPVKAVQYPWHNKSIEPASSSQQLELSTRCLKTLDKLAPIARSLTTHYNAWPEPQGPLFYPLLPPVLPPRSTLFPFIPRYPDLLHKDISSVKPYSSCKSLPPALLRHSLIDPPLLSLQLARAASPTASNQLSNVASTLPRFLLRSDSASPKFDWFPPRPSRKFHPSANFQTSSGYDQGFTPRVNHPPPRLLSILSPPLRVLLSLLVVQEVFRRGM